MQPKKLLFQLSVVSTVSNILLFIYLHALLQLQSVIISHNAAYVIASIFAYGQTSSGKTYTMNGITHLAVNDIYDYMEKVY